MNQACYHNKNFLWGGVISDVLVKLGVKFAVLCPGSRSAPLTYAFGTHSELESMVIIDERSAAFFALGVAKSGQTPVVLVCTSGTAVANFLPAVIEAHYSRVPLLVLTADRPPELRGCSAEQTIEQGRIFSHYANWYCELAMPGSAPAQLRYLRQTLAHAVERCRYPVLGPVHLNVPFEDVLAPIKTENAGLPDAAVVDAIIESTLQLIQPPTQLASWPSDIDLNPCQRGLIIVGSSHALFEGSSSSALKSVANKLGWPVLLDVLSPLRNSVDTDSFGIAHYDAILRSASCQQELRPDIVLNVGPLPTSKVLRNWLQSLDVCTYIIDTGIDNLDPLHRNAVRLPMAVGDLDRLLPKREPGGCQYAAQWLELEQQVAGPTEAALGNCDFLFEGKVPYLLSRELPPGTPVFIGNSSPIRDAEYFWQKNAREYRPFYNRGANGIDGIVSTAMGVAHKCDQAAVLVCGDLTLLHDSNGLLNARRMRGSLTIVLINNQGGGIFENLPIAQFDPPFEEYFATPQAIDFAQLAAAHGIPYQLITDWNYFTLCVRNLPVKGVRVLEMRTDRKCDAAFRKQLCSVLLKK